MMMKPMHYRIHIQGYLDLEWQDWLHGLTITHCEERETVLSGPLADQAALHGILTQLYDLGLPLLAVNTVPPDDQS
ncbi:hypothetical protein [Dictyobacter aurantiacus]|uniref:Uncharacterized protein n=1 Tax=Dictyobacter aurantiacus TaxID=1936993 RepID=A0A401ZTD2_9CHLR|nr:hypothetical protein [Dictyobacter aurantiacus]GCE10056.1 hypothetical protein KDAU_73850 [Dictyobacter aurantiacus]